MTLTACTFAQYQKIRAVNWSWLSTMRTSPRHFEYARSHPRADTAAMAKGRAVHTAVLEPDALLTRYTLWEGARRGKEWEEFKAVNAAKQILTGPEWDDVLAIRDAVRAHTPARRLLRGGRAEVTVRWVDRASGVRCKARADYLRPGTLIDLKTTRSLDERDFERTFHKLGYHCQLGGMYVPGLEANGKHIEHVYVVAVESDPPHDVAVFEPTEDALYAGQQEVAELLALVRRCRTTRRWPGRYPKTTSVDLPSWYYAQADALLEMRS